ncbi:MAG: hypothetical protein UW68_C0016G0010 [Candidatus Collierbacteria bacterium GW2011_GWB1_44_6]|uniref:Uncharacterized protein n=1 Tax=Candidatus Collierbacteria bacterium GW2011_GWB1_44_6 TaxID=1618384 RepID=A0A0G1JP52_9BACT|nr:MAG: hypothetical protein UW68_C0016G0010 [Candidatus Collierbacteria bacterium GW2011_GWB1_44_6]
MALLRCNDADGIMLVIRQMLCMINEKLTVRIDLSDVDIVVSTACAMENEEYFEGRDVDADDEHKQAIRLVMATVYYDGSSVINDFFLEAMSNIGRCCFSEVAPGELGVAGSEQVVHSDLMVTNADQIKKGKCYFLIVNHRPAALITVEKVESDKLFYTERDGIFVKRGVRNLSAFGVLPLEDGSWNVWNWIEPVETG